ncbi:Hsp70 family protein [Mycobacterium sp. NPDC051804]|uniref:Hsp70 family protein n=1 Tax=Mycobacterium sp. NPDC051804 TaxID=3364295 RepID=UPI0037AF74FE
MSDGLGLSVGATRLTAVVVGRAALSRSSVLTRFPHRPPEVGVPSENPNLNERGLILTDFVDRVGDPVGIVAADGSTHLADGVLADALRALLFTMTGGRPPADPVGVTYPAHWRPAAVEGLRSALAGVPEFSSAPLVSDATAAVTALQADPGVPTRGIIALCDFGGTGTSITLLDADAGYAPLAPTVRHTDLSGDLVDQALLTHVINDLSTAGSIDLSGTSAIGSLTRLRAECRNAKERLSTASVTSLMADVPGHRGEVRVTRTELDDAIRQPVADFAGVLQETLERNGVRELAAVASVGGGARIPIITTTLSDRFRVPVITNGQPDLTAAIGGGLTAVRGTVEDGQTAMAAAAAAAAPATEMAPEVVPLADEMAPSGGALAWSDANDLPEVAPTDHYDYDSPADSPADAADVRPQIQFQSDPHDDERSAKALPWYRRPEIAMGAGVLAVLAALAAAVIFVMRSGDTPPETASTTAPAQPSTTSAEAPPPPAETEAPPQETVMQQAPPPPVTETVTASPTEPPPPPPTTEAPSPTTEAPPPPPTTTQPPPSTPPPPPTIPTLPYETIPGLPFVPNPIQPPQPAP